MRRTRALSGNLIRQHEAILKAKVVWYCLAWSYFLMTTIITKKTAATTTKTEQELDIT